MAHQKYLLTLSVIFIAVFITLGIAPLHRSDWLLENVLVVIAGVLMVLSYKYFPLSRLSYTLIFLFMLLHQVGAHYTYAEVPYDEFFLGYLGFSLNDLLGWERNNFDRVVHFLYGLLLAYPIKELYSRVARAEGFWGYFFPLELTMASSMVYELIEWAAAEVFGGELGMAYLGTQGDIWDAHKDMALASLGALIAMLITMLINMRIQDDFWEEWRSSLSIKSNVPLGEDELSRLIHPEARERR